MNSRLYFVICISAIYINSVYSQNDTVRLKFLSDSCKYQISKTRIIINDSTYVDLLGERSDTLELINRGEKLRLRSGDTSYLLMDIKTDFLPGSSIFHYYYFGFPEADYDYNSNELYFNYKERMIKNVIIYVPKSIVTSNKTTTYYYYVLGECFPLNRECIEAQILNGNFKIVGFEPDIGIVEYDWSGRGCRYRISEDSYNLILKNH